MSELLELADRCEQATEAKQWELLKEAYQLVYGGPETIPIPVWPGYKSPRWDRFHAMLQCEAYESAAMTLVPEGWRVSMLEEDWQTGLWRAQLGPKPTPALLSAYKDGRTVGWHTAESNSKGLSSVATAPLALCAAALRARAA